MQTSNFADYNHAHMHSKKRRHNRRWLSACLIILIILLAGGYEIRSRHVSAERATAHQVQVEAAADVQRKARLFSSQVNALLTANPADTIGVVTASSGSALQTYGSTTPFDAASDGKLLTAADYLHHVEQGTASLQQNIDGQSAEYWLRIMLVNSDDTAWEELNEYLTHPDLQAYGNTIGFTDYDPTTNTFPPIDAARLLQKLYNGQLLNSADRSLMLGYLAEANYRQYIVPAVPKGDAVYHKIGLDVDEVNDAAIITSGQKYLVLVIFTNGNGTDTWPARAQLMQAIAKDAITAYL